MLATYLANLDVEVVTVGTPDGTVSPDELARGGRRRTRPACWCSIRIFSAAWKTWTTLAKAAHERGALFIVAVDPISLGLLKRPGRLRGRHRRGRRAIAGQPDAFGGPYLGIMACREQFVRRMPGRIAGQTVDRRGKRCWVLTLQTREQHIRRERPRATSARTRDCSRCGRRSIWRRWARTDCANGRTVPAEIALRGETACQPASGFRCAFDRPTFKEFVVRDSADARRRAAGRGARRRILRRRAAGPLVSGTGRLLPRLRDREAHPRKRSTACSAACLLPRSTDLWSVLHCVIHA